MNALPLGIGGSGLFLGRQIAQLGADKGVHLRVIGIQHDVPGMFSGRIAVIVAGGFLRITDAAHDLAHQGGIERIQGIDGGIQGPEHFDAAHQIASGHVADKKPDGAGIFPAGQPGPDLCDALIGQYFIVAAVGSNPEHRIRQINILVDPSIVLGLP